MDVTFSNPVGFWALMGIPAILLIHFLQRESRRVVTSTFFLWEQLSPISAEGRRFERLRNSIPLWLQLLAVLLLTWLLVQPRWLRKDSALSVVVVVDSSISMTAFREPLIAALRERLAGLKKVAARTEWMLLESDTTRPTLYSGGDLDALFAGLTRWEPRLGEHDPAPSVRVARSLLRENGVALFVSDHVRVLPEGVELLAVGHPIENCGFVGVSVEGDSWRALVKNHGSSPQSRTYQIEAAGGVSAPLSVDLAAGQTQVLRGGFPAGIDRCTLALSSDQFAVDDRLPILRPQPKRLSVGMELGTPLEPFFRRFVSSIANTVDVAADADVFLSSIDPAAPVPIRAGIAFAADAPDSSHYLKGDVVAERHPLTAELSWQGLLCKETPAFPSLESDQTLLWQGERPLIFLRTHPGGAHALVVNFDLKQSNADRLPAFVVLLHRFAESIRASKVAPEKLNVGTNQLLAIAATPAGPPVQSTASTGPVTVPRAPAVPGFFQVTQGPTTLLTAAAHFGDPREGDFRQAASNTASPATTAKLIERNSRQDFLVPLWALLLGGVFVANWAITGRRA